jgi:hypothetical protein
MNHDRLQSQRCELKYFVPEHITEAVREFIRAHLVLDQFGAGRADFSYPIHSVYLDSDALALYWDTIKGAKNRYKLRLRFYDDDPLAPVFFEIKRRYDDAISKLRAAVRRQAVSHLLAGQMPQAKHLISDNPKQLLALQRFSALMLLLHARPKTHVAYSREAWVTQSDNSVRVTMDRHVRSEPDPKGKLITEMSSPVRVFGSDVILELKFTGRFPNWFAEMVRVLGLERRSAAKYAAGITLIGEDQLSPAKVSWKLPASGSSTTPHATRNRALVEQSV